MSDVHNQRSRSLSLLGILLQSLHFLFGITAIIGMLIAHSRLASTKGTIYYSHLKWQLVTFWCAFAGYAVSAWLWVHTELHWPALVVAGFVIYRLCINAHNWYTEQSIDRLL